MIVFFVTFLAILVWWLVGTLGFVYWWTTEHESLVGNDVIFALTFGGFLGPIAWIAGYGIHGRKPKR